MRLGYWEHSRMTDHLNAIKAALRIVASATARQPLTKADVMALRAYAPDLQDLSDEALAIEVMPRAVRCCEESRRARAAVA